MAKQYDVVVVGTGPGGTSRPRRHRRLVKILSDAKYGELLGAHPMLSEAVKEAIHGLEGHMINME